MDDDLSIHDRNNLQTHNEDGTAKPEYLNAIRAVNFVLQNGFAYTIDPDWTGEFLAHWLTFVNLFALEKGYMPSLRGRTLKLIKLPDNE